MRVFIHTLGCKQNYAESSYIRSQFESAGYTIVGAEAECDVFVVNTCTVTENADSECRKIIRRVLRRSPQARVAVTGCYAQLQPEEIASIDGVDVVVGSAQKFSIPSILQKHDKGISASIHVDELGDLAFTPALFDEHDRRTRGFLKIQDGCDYNCSFCTIPKARGASRSMSAPAVLKELKQLSQWGFREVIITGINLGEYCSLEGVRFPELISMIADTDIDCRVRISSIEPNKLTRSIIETVASSDRFCRHFHIPLQSGSDEILRRMRRRYTSSQYRELIRSVHEHIDFASIGIDVITGFPGETPELFQETVDFLHDLDFSYLHVFSYSERELTPAAGYADKVPVQVRRQRTHVLQELSRAKQQKFYQKNIGRELEVVPEFCAPGAALRHGYSNEYIRLAFDADTVLPSTLVRVLLDSVDETGARGQLIESTDKSRSQPRSQYIPLPLC